jgi:hypothetical protein
MNGKTRGGFWALLSAVVAVLAMSFSVWASIKGGDPGFLLVGLAVVVGAIRGLTQNDVYI